MYSRNLTVKETRESLYFNFFYPVIHFWVIFYSRHLRFELPWTIATPTSTNRKSAKLLGGIGNP